MATYDESEVYALINRAIIWNTDNKSTPLIDWWDENKKPESPTPLVQEDVEKAAHAFASKPHYKDGRPLSISPMLYMKQGFIAGAKWQAATVHTAPLPSNIVEQLRLANPYNENWGGLSGTREYEAWVKSVSKLRELLSSQPVQGNEPENKYKLPGHDETMGNLDNLTIKPK